jgi:dihydroneopterin aldolase
MDCRRLFLRDYEVWINIGVHDFEKTGEQRVLINVDLYVPLALSTPADDKLRRGGGLRLHPPQHRRAGARGHIHLQETLADDVLR